MHRTYSNNTPLRLLTLLFGLSLLWACSDSNNNSTNLAVPVDAEFPDYKVVTLAPGDDLETRAQEALITA